MKMSLASVLVAGALLGAASSQATVVNVGGVTWDTDAVTNNDNGVEMDFTSHGPVREQALGSTAPGTQVMGWGHINQLNFAAENQASFCPSGCQLTYTFSMALESLGAGSTATKTAFSFKDLVVNVFLDNLGAGGSAATPYIGTYASASNGVPFLTLALMDGTFLSGEGENIGSVSGSDTGTGTAYMKVTGGLAAAYFDTNTFVGGADMVFSSSFNALPGSSYQGRPLLTGTFNLSGNSVNVVPEPSSLALLGLSLVGLAGLRRRK